jgi:hypothetical protein
MGKLVNAKSLRLGYNPDINWGLRYPDSGWYGHKVVRDYRLSTYLRALVRELMERRKENFRQIGCWYSHCQVKRKGVIFEVQLFFYEAEMDDFLPTGRRRLRVTRRNKMFMKKRLKIKFLMCEFMRRKLKVDMQMLLGREISVKFCAIAKKHIRASTLGEYIVRRLYDGENVYGVFSDTKKMFDFHFSNLKKEEEKEEAKGRARRLRLRREIVERKLRFVQGKNDISRTKRSKRILYILNNPLKRRIRRSKWRGKRVPLGKIRGVKVMGSGMFIRKHKRMSQHLSIVSGKVPLSTIMYNIDYMNFDIMLKTSKCSIKVWINRGESNVKVNSDMYAS